MSEYIVLRDSNFNPRIQPGPFGFDTFSGGGAIANGRSSLPPSPTISVEQMTKADVDDMRRDPAVQAITRRMPISLIRPVGRATSDDTGNTWGIEAVRADQSPFDGSGIKVAVLDTGIDPTHDAFSGVNLDLKNFTGGADSATDGDGHGTHCAGTIFGRDVDGLRIGVARGVSEAAIGKVLGDDGSGSSEMLFAGMQWARSSGAKVISMSVGFDFPGLVKRLIDDGWPAKLAASVAIEAYRGNVRAFDALMNMFRAMAEFDGGTIVVAASGNESERQIDPRFEVSSSLPAAAFDVISVGALGQSGAGLSVADFSNTNPVLSAPGVNVLSAKVGGGTVALNGTSMACPHVAGLTALWWQALSSTPIPLTSEGVRARLRVAADTSVFTSDTDIADRGEGLAIAPSGNAF